MPYSASIGLVTINCKYVHLALSLRYLRNAARRAGFGNVWLREFTLKTPPEAMLEELLALRPEVLGFSVYIWNREASLALIARLKARDPALTIVIGGPEVSFEADTPPGVDVVIAGEGETKWVEFLTGWAAHWQGAGAPDAATLARWRVYGNELPALEQSPYLPEDLVDLRQRLAYLETSRGCPFHCSFCLSALDKPVRFFSDAQVQADVRRLVAAGARRIKFLDRTFNLRPTRVLEFFRFLSGFAGVEFHFEVVGDLLTEPLVAFLETVPAGMFQFEVGVQSADPAVNARVERRQSQAKLFAAMARLRAAERVHLHADLIWGLPGETLEQIRAGFDTVLALRPHQLQLGFLKFLPGAPIRQLIAAHEYRFQARPPYEVLAHRDLAAHEVLRLKQIEKVFDALYNSGHFRFTLGRLLQSVTGWKLFSGFTDWLQGRGLLGGPLGLEVLTRELLAWGLAQTGLRIPALELADWLKLDTVYQHRIRRVPGFLKVRPVAEPAAIRALRKAQPLSAVVPFWHTLHWQGSQVRLEPSAEPLWYRFTYPAEHTGYFFRPEVEPVLLAPPPEDLLPQAPSPAIASAAGG